MEEIKKKIEVNKNSKSEIGLKSQINKKEKNDK